MATLSKISAAFFLVFTLSVSHSAAQTQSPDTDQGPSLADVARTYRAEKSKDQVTRPDIKQLTEELNSKDEDSAGPEQFKDEVQQLLVERKFDELEKLSEQVRSRRSKFTGGVWKLFMFYDVIPHPPDGTFHLEAIKAWVGAKPESAAARTALAQAYVSSGLRSRGSGRSDTVSESGWSKLADGSGLAGTTLLEADRLGKDAYWFEVMQQVALAQGWDKKKTRELFEQAIAFEPDYYHYYREYANYLLPRWYGENGEVEAFAEETYERVGGQEGLFLYFEIASVISCMCDSENPRLEGMSWPRVKEGFSALQELYGTTNLKNNRFAMMAYRQEDKAAAKPVMEKIGSGWDRSVWVNRNNFENARNWALADQSN